MSSELQFGRVEVRPAERQLLIDGAPAALGSRAFDLLIALIERRDRVVEKGELLELVWPGLVVEENNLQVQVTTLRKLLGARAVTTVPGRGYRFTLDSQAVGNAPPSACTTPDPMRDSTPRPLTSFVGREAELESIARLLGSSRLLSLTGIGGSGKTRLAIELGHRVAQRFVDGVRFVDLAPVNSADRVVLEVARAAGVVEEPNRPVVDTLARRLASSNLLLILDNCEHVLDACAALVGRVLAECEHVQVLVTSREALDVEGEQIVAVRPLSLPAAGGGTEAALASEAVQLFVGRAQLVVPGFTLDAHNIASVVDVCRRLDGIPLAIELAAARLRVLSVGQIRDKLGDRFRLLTAGSRSVSRHQTLQAALQWSYEHLAPDEQLLLRRASVFTGGWTLEAATAVAGQGDSDIDLVDRLGRLVDKSLISVDHDADGSTRFGMLETVRQYAQQELQASGEAVAAHDAHLACFLAFAAQARAQISTQFVATLARIDSEIPNLLAAHAWCDQPHVPPERGLELVAMLRRYWIERDQFTLGQQMFEEALRRPGVERPTPQRAQALFSLGQHLYLAGRHAEALGPLSEALALARAHDDRNLQVLCLNKLSGSHLMLGELKEARAYAEQGIEAARAIGSPMEVSLALDALGAVCRFEGRFDDAAAAYGEAKRSLPKGDLGNEHAYTRSLAYIAVARGRFDEARQLLIECIRMARQYDVYCRNYRDLEVATHLASGYGDWSRAARIRGAVEAAADRIGPLRYSWDDPVLAKARHLPREALGDDAYHVAWEAGYALDLATALDEVLGWLEEPGCGRPEAT